MKRTAILILAGFAATAVGMALGTRTAQETRDASPREDAPPVEATVAIPDPMPTKNSPVNFQDDVEALLTSLAGSDEDALIALLQRTVSDSSLSPQLALFCRDALIGRLVELGAGERSLRATSANAREREEMLRVVVKNFAEQNPAAAEEMTFRLPAGKERQMAVRELLGTLGTNNPQRAMEILRTHPEARAEGSELFRAWAKQEPPVATVAALTLQKELGGFFASSALYSWADTDPPGAWKWVQQLPSEDQQWALSTYANALVNKDPSAALDTILRTPELRESSFAGMIGNRLAVDATSANALLDRVPPGQLRTELARGAASGLLRQDPALAMEWAQTLLPGERDAVMAGVFNQLGMNDPEAGIRLATKHLEGPAAEAAISRTVQGWAMTQPEPALKALVQHLDNEALKRALPTVLSPTYLVVGQDFGRRLEFIAGLDPELRPVVLRASGAQWGAMDPYAVRDHLAGLDPDDRALLVEGLISGVNDSHPQLAAEYAAWLPPEKQLANAGRISDAIARSDPAAAATFLNQLPGRGANARSAGENLVRDWVYQDASAAAAFATSLPAGATRDAVSYALARELKNFDLDGATRVLSGVTTTATRARLIRELASTWSRVDAQRGRALLAPLLRSDEDRKNAAELMKNR